MYLKQNDNDVQALDVARRFFRKHKRKIDETIIDTC